MGDTDNPHYGPPIDSDDDSSETEEEKETHLSTLDDHTTGEESENLEKPDGEGDATKTPDGPSTGGGGGVSGGVPPGGAPIPSPTPGEPSNGEPDDSEETDPESPEESETRDDLEIDREPEQSDTQSDRGKNSDDSEQKKEDDHNDNDDEKTEAKIVVQSDAWDSIGWGIYPVRLQLKEEYGDQVQFDDRLVSVREFNSPEEIKQHWQMWAPRHGMPVNTDVWSGDPPESTELTNRAFAAAREQSIHLAKQFMRRLKVATIVEGVNVEDREELFNLAINVGLDRDQLENDWDTVDVQTSSGEVKTPKTTIQVDDETITQPGLVTANDLRTPLRRAGLESEDPQQLSGFVDKYGPVTVTEVSQVYDCSKKEAREKLQALDSAKPNQYGEATFWV